MTRVLIDTDIILEIINDDLNCEESLKIINNFDVNNVEAFVTAQSILEVCEGLDKDTTKQVSRILDIVFNIVDLRMNDINKAFIYKNIKNGIIINQAKRMKIDYIITRDIDKYIDDKIKAIYPKQLLEELKHGKEIRQKRNI